MSDQDITRLNSFKIKVIKKIPLVHILALTNEEWIELNHRCAQKHRAKQTIPFLLIHLSDIKKIDYHSLVTTILKKKLNLRPITKRPQVTSRPNQRKREHLQGVNGENSLIFNSDICLSPITKTGARTAVLSDTSPEPGYHNVKLMPGEGKVRQVYGNFFKPLTPLGNREQGGRVNPVKLRPKKLSFDKVKPRSYTITAEHLRERQSTRRPVSQKMVMGMTCLQIFLAHISAMDSEDSIITEDDLGRYYHLSHVQAYSQGGEQAQYNLIPGTAASNYNTLEIVEQFIKEKLINDKVERMECRATPHYTEDSLIPYSLTYELTWLDPETNILQFEEININPTSHQRITKAMLETIRVMRQLDKEGVTPSPLGGGVNP